MLKLILCIIIGVVAVHGAGELVILHSPDSVQFSGHDPVDGKIVKEIFSASLGFTIKQKSDWTGLEIRDPFNLPEVAVVFFIDGVPDVDFLGGVAYPLTSDEDESVTWEALRDRIESRKVGLNATLVRVDVTDQADTGIEFLVPYDSKPVDWNVKYLDYSSEEDRRFLDEMAVLIKVAKLVKTGVKGDGVTDLYWFVERSLHPVIDFHGPDSDATKEAKKILKSTIETLSKAFIDGYDGKVIVGIICSDVSHTRRSRSLMQQKAAEEPADLNLAPEYSADYPVIFNIMLWFGVAFVFCLLAISMFIADMDPGRDSIIYRMTSTRMKKDN